MNILSEPLVNYIILFSFLIFFFLNRDLQFIKKIVIFNLSRLMQLFYMLFISANNSFK